MEATNKGLNTTQRQGVLKDDGTIVISTEIALYRNVAGYKFVATESRSKLKEILTAITECVEDTVGGNYHRYTPENQDPFIGELWVENQITSIGFEDKDCPMCVFVSRCSNMVIVVNDINHIKLYVKKVGLKPEKCWTLINRLDDEIEKNISYAFSPQFGYLTTSLKDAGTGMHASVIMHLPALAMRGTITDLYDFAEAKDVEISGCRSDCEPEGDLYKLTNNITIGKSEEEILTDLRKVAIGIANSESQARYDLIHEDFDILVDSTQRALGTLRYARMINFIEAANLLSKVRLGILTQTIREISLLTIDELLEKTKPAKMNYDSCETLDYDRQDVLRAETIREALS